MAGLDPAIHVNGAEVMDARIKSTAVRFKFGDVRNSL
jgi:hypothetical protein